MSHRPSRREFLGKSLVSLAATTAVQSAPLAFARGANDRLRVGLIGCGGRGVHDAGLFQRTPNVELVWVCDVDEARRAQAAKSLGVPDNRAVADLRTILDDRSIDLVIIATPDHWHTPASILSCDAGKHVYVEKPISHNVREGRLLVDAAARNKTLVQHGTQCRSTSMMIDAIAKLRDGIIGNVLMAKCWNIQRRESLGVGRDTEPPPGFDYDTWSGPAPMIPYRTTRVHHRWTMWYHFGAGDMGNDGVHDIDYARWGLGVETHPTRITGHGGKYYFDGDGDFPDTQQVTFEYASGASQQGRKLLIYEQRLWSTNYPHNCDSGAEFYGDKGQLFLSRRGKLELLTDRNKPQDASIKPVAQDDLAHVGNLCDAIRKGTTLHADALTGHLSTSLCHLGNISTRVGRSLTFDPLTEQIVDDPSANALIQRTYRDHWGTPRHV